MGRALALLNNLISDLSFADQPLAAAKPPAPEKSVAAPPAQKTPAAAKPAVAEAKAAAVPQAKAAAAKAAAPAAPAAPVPSSGLPSTEALYQTDTYLFTCEASVLAVSAVEGDAGGWVVMLDRTCFHPQGGGQPADTGTITSLAGGDAFAVSMVRKDPTGVVRHEGAAAKPAFAVGDKVRCVVDESPRLKNARVHSAGHLIDVAMSANNVPLRPTKGYHFTPGAYVEYGESCRVPRNPTLQHQPIHTASLFTLPAWPPCQPMDAH